MASFMLSSAEKVDVSNVTYRLHNHDNYEIYMFFEGDTDYIVEGRTYSLEPYDMIIIRRHEMHRAYHKSNAPYSRFVINILPEFFAENNCPEYERRFKDANSSEGNKISADVVRSVGLYNAYVRLMEYSNNCTIEDSPVIRSIITEMLYLIDKVTNFSYDDSSNKQIKRVISYIGAHFTEDIDLDNIADKFFLSKYYLCHIFKKKTGMTLHKYITHKRITHVRELVADGMNITEAVVNAGFNNYSSFYRAYLKEFDTPPRRMSEIITQPDNGIEFRED